MSIADTRTSDQGVTATAPAEDPGSMIDLTTPAGTTPDQPTSAGPPPAEPSVAGRPQFTITDAATACAVSRKTITRKLADLAEHGAAKDDDGVWRIPVEALLAVGLHPGRSVPEPAPRTSGLQTAIPATLRPVPSPTPVGQDMVSVPRDRWDDLRIRLARAEAEAAERALALADARLALRALTAAPGASGPGSTYGMHEAAPSHAVSLAPATSASALPTTPPDPVVEPNPISSTPTGVAVDEPGTGSAGQTAPGAPSPTMSIPGTPAPPESADPVALARSQAAQTGGYVPAAGPAPAKRRRWWQSK